MISWTWRDSIGQSDGPQIGPHLTAPKVPPAIDLQYQIDSAINRKPIAQFSNQGGRFLRGNGYGDRRLEFRRIETGRRAVENLAIGYDEFIQTEPRSIRGRFRPISWRQPAEDH